MSTKYWGKKENTLVKDKGFNVYVHFCSLLKRGWGTLKSTHTQTRDNNIKVLEGGK